MKLQHKPQATFTRNSGLTLVELMVSMVLGLVVAGGAVSLMLANRQSYRTNEALSQVQESARTAFELLARDIRQAGINGCDNTGRIANVLKPGSPSFWWQDWFGMRGYDDAQTDPAVAFDTAQNTRVAGTDSIQVQGIQGTGLSVESHDEMSANFKINATTTDFTVNDILIVCDFDHAAIFQVSNYNNSNVTVVHNTGAGPPGNCSKGLDFPSAACPPPNANGNPYTFGRNSQIARFAAADWYIGNNGRPEEGGRSLYRRSLGSGATPLTEEIIAGVVDMQIQYRLANSNDFVDATSITVPNDWTNVNAVMITLTMDSADRNVSTDPANTGRLSRSYTHIVTLRNRVP